MLSADLSWAHPIGLFTHNPQVEEFTGASLQFFLVIKYHQNG
jgi:hypothetical protein